MRSNIVNRKDSDLFRAAMAGVLALAILFGAAPALMAQDRPPEARSSADRVPDAAPEQDAAVPATLKALVGTLVMVRTTSWLSSDHNRQGETFMAVLEQPIIVDGWVVARRGQTVIGAITVADKGGRVKGVSQLGVELAELTLVDGQQIPLRTQLLKSSGGTSYGQDAATIAVPTALGAAIGAAADEGRGAGIGAGAGAVAGILGVLFTRGRQTVIPAETVLTFRLQEAATISTERSQFAFRQVSQDDYGRDGGRRPRLAPGYSRPYPPRYCSYCSPYPHYYYPGYFYPGPSFIGVFGFGSRRFRRW
jgi:hypothetical protein